eukprot:1161240-Pelagomonas_calceolata.AAC.9
MGLGGGCKEGNVLTDYSTGNKEQAKQKVGSTYDLGATRCVSGDVRLARNWEGGGEGACVSSQVCNRLGVDVVGEEAWHMMCSQWSRVTPQIGTIWQFKQQGLQAESKWNMSRGNAVSWAPPKMVTWGPFAGPAAQHIFSANHAVQAGPVIDAGGIFDYARKTGMIKTSA